jgi:hypothetical protein
MRSAQYAKATILSRKNWLSISNRKQKAWYTENFFNNPLRKVYYIDIQRFLSLPIKGETLNISILIKYRQSSDCYRNSGQIDFLE